MKKSLWKNPLQLNSASEKDKKNFCITNSFLPQKAAFVRPLFISRINYSFFGGSGIINLLSSIFAP